MQQSDEARIRGLYPELLERPDDDALLRLIEILDAGYTARRASEALRSNPPRRLPAAGTSASLDAASGMRRTQSRRFRMLSMPAVAVLVALILAAGAVLAVPPAANITDLGRPTNAVPQDQPLGDFRRVGVNLRQGSKPEVLFIGTEIDQASAIERWPVVKALSQFGSFTHLRAMHVTYCVGGTLQQWQAGTCRYVNPNPLNGEATFDWSDAHYTSRYLVFMPRELIDRTGKVHDPLTRHEHSLYARYAHLPERLPWSAAVWRTVLDGLQGHPPQYPLLFVGDHLQMGAPTALPGDLSETMSTRALSFATIQHSLQKGRNLDGAAPNLVFDVNAEANVITALICHGDGNRPARVCGRSTIKGILRHVRRD